MLTATGERKTPYLFGLLDDCSRVCSTRSGIWNARIPDLVHGLSQGIQERGPPRALFSDNGSPMKAAETIKGWSGSASCGT